ncbi:MAG TPA: FG-GAP-like repeat-containing protein, partial [Candidatus Limnocylindrales bacterium]|nr:FG-GAP-like repeat-containing protein [Candidatus Limnocylindrales bacterium]
MAEGRSVRERSSVPIARWTRLICVVVALACVVSGSAGAGTAFGHQAPPPRAAGPVTISWDEVSPALLRSALIVREFQNRVRPAGPTAKLDQNTRIAMTGAELHSVVVRVATLLVRYRGGAVEATVIDRLAAAEMANLTRRPDPGAAVDVDEIVQRVVAATQALRDAAHALSAPSAPGADVVADKPLSAADLADAADRAKDDWARNQPGVDLSGLSFTVADLPGLEIGHADGKHITIDATAAGYGWDVTYPADASARMDLLTAVRHEIGHAVGREHVDGGLMGETLSPGVAHSVPSAPSDPAPSAPAPTNPAPSAPAPTDATPSDATPSDATPSDAAPSDATAPAATPSDATPCDASPSGANASDATASDAAPGASPCDGAPSSASASDVNASDANASDATASDATPFGGTPADAVPSDLASVDPAAATQTIYVSLGGARDVTFTGPVVVQHIDIPALALPAHLRGQEDTVAVSLKGTLDSLFSGRGITVTLSDPGADRPHSTIYVGGDSSLLHAGCGVLYGVSEKVDAGNRDPGDIAFVFSESLPSVAQTATEYARDLATYVAHEAGHLLGYEHAHTPDTGAGCAALADVAFKPYTHVEIAKDVRLDIMTDGVLEIAGRQYQVHPAIRDAISQYPSFYYAGAVGPDGFPDLAFGQSKIHPTDTGTWIARVLDMAWAAQTDAAFTPAERLQVLAWSYGFATHAAGDMWAHTLINEFSEGVFPSVAELGENRDLANAVRHNLLESYIADTTPGLDRNPDRSVLPNGDVSDDATAGIAFNAPIQFIYEVLIKPFPGDPTAQASTFATQLTAHAATRTFTRTSGNFRDEGFVDGLVIRAYGFNGNKGPFRVVHVEPLALTVAEPLTDEVGNNAWLASRGSRGPIVDQFLDLQTMVDQLAAQADGTRGPPTRPFNEIVDEVIPIVAAGGLPSPELADELFRAYLHNWSAEIADGLHNWAALGLATSEGLFNADARRRAQNEAGENFGADVDGTRANAEGDVDLVDTFMRELEDPNHDGREDDSFITEHLLPMYGVPERLAMFRAGLAAYGELIDDSLVGPVRLVLNPVLQALDRLQEIPRQFLLKAIEQTFGIPVDLLEQLSGLSNKMDLAVVTVGDTVVPVWKPGDHEKIDLYMGINGIAQSLPLDPRLVTREGLTYYADATRAQDENVEFDKTKFAAYFNAAVLSKMLLLHETAPGSLAAGPSDGQLSQLIDDLLGDSFSPMYNFGLNNLVGAHGGNIMTARLPMPGKDARAEIREFGPFFDSIDLVLHRPLDAAPWLRLIDGDQMWRDMVYTTTTMLYRVSVPNAAGAKATWTQAQDPEQALNGTYTFQASWLANVTQRFANPDPAKATEPLHIAPATRARYAIYEVIGATKTLLATFSDVNQRAFPDDTTDENGISFETLGPVTFHGGWMQVELTNALTDESLLAGPVRLMRGTAEAVRLQNNRDPESLASLSPTEYVDDENQWDDMTHEAGNGNFPLWESELLRPVFKKLFRDWQNGPLLQFPGLRDGTSPDPNQNLIPLPTQVKYVTPFEQRTVATPSGPLLIVSGAMNLDCSVLACTSGGDLKISGIRGNGDAIADTLVLTVRNLTITGAVGGGGLAGITLIASGTILVGADVVISARQIAASADPRAQVTDPSIGNSGPITLRGAHIVLGPRSAVVAHGTGSFTSADVIIEASQATSLTWFSGVIGFTAPFDGASVDVGADTVIRGRDVRVTSQAHNVRTADERVLNPSDFGLFESLAADVETFLARYQGRAIAVRAAAEARTTIGVGTIIIADRDLLLSARAEAELHLRTLGRHFGLTFGSTTPTADLAVGDGAALTAGRDLNLRASTDNRVEVVTVVPDGGDVAGVSVAFGQARGTSSASVRPGARLNAVNVVVAAENLNWYSTVAVGARFLAVAAPDLAGSFSAGLGVAAAIGFYQSSASASVAATVNATNLTVRSRSENLLNQTRAFASITTPAGASALNNALRAFLGGLDLTVHAGDRALNPRTTGTDLAAAAAVTLAETENKAAALIDDGAWMTLSGTLTVDATAIDRFTSSASAHAETAANGAAAALNWSRPANQATAFIGYNTVVDVTHRINVSALAELASPIPGFVPPFVRPVLSTPPANATGTGAERIQPEFTNAGAIGNQIAIATAPLTGFLLPFLLDPNLVGTAYVHGGAAGSTSAVVGGLNLLTVYNLAAAGIAAGALVNRRGAVLVGADQDVAVNAVARLTAVSLAGLPSALSLPGGSGGEISVGGYVNLLFADDYARAYIDDRAKVTGRDVILNSLTDVTLLQAVAQGAAGADIVIDGAFGIVVLGHESLAAIEDRAEIIAVRDILITADNATRVVNVAGARALGLPTAGGQGTVRVGVAVAVTVLTSPGTLIDRAEQVSMPDPLPQQLEINPDWGDPESGSSVRAFIGNGAEGMNDIGTGGVVGLVTAGNAIRVTASNRPSANEFWTLALAGDPSTQSLLPAILGLTQFGTDFGLGISGDAAMNLINRRTQAFIRDLHDRPLPDSSTDYRVRAGGPISLTATDEPLLVAAAGATVGANSAGIGASFTLNDLTVKVRAFTADAALRATSLTVLATAHPLLLSYADGSGVSAAANVAGSVNLIDTDILAEAALGARTRARVQGAVSVQADSTCDAVSDAGAMSFAVRGLLAIGAALDNVHLGNRAQAFVGLSAVVSSADGDVVIRATSVERIRTFAAALSTGALGGQAIQVYDNRGPPVFQQSTFGPASTTTSVAVGDLNGDGLMDIVTGNFAQYSRRYLALPSGGFDAGKDIGNDLLLFATGNSLPSAPNHDEVTSSQVPELTTSIALGDIDGDGDLDVVLGNFMEPNRFFLNDGRGDFRPGNTVAWPDPFRPTSVVRLADLDGDNRLDLIVGTYGKGLYWYHNTGRDFVPRGLPIGPQDAVITSIDIADLDKRLGADIVAGTIGIDLTGLLDKGLIAVQNLVDTAVVRVVDLVQRNLVRLVDLVERRLLTVLDANGLTAISVADLVNSGLTSLEDLILDGLLGLDDFADRSVPRSVLIATGLVTAEELNAVFPGTGPISLRALVQSRLVQLRELADEGLLRLEDLRPGSTTLPLGEVVKKGAADLRQLITEGLVDLQAFLLAKLNVRDLLNSGLVTLGRLINENLVGRDTLDLSGLSYAQLRAALKQGAPTVVYLQVTPGVFAAPIEIAFAPTMAVAIGDVNQDTNPDIVLGNAFARPMFVANLGLSQNVLRFAAPVSIGTTAADEHLTMSVALGDMDRDPNHTLDLVVGNLGSPNRLYRFNKATNTFGPGTDLSPNAFFTTSIALADFNRDGDLDVVASSNLPGLGVAGSIAIASVDVDTAAYVANGADVRAGLSVTIDARDTADIVSAAGAAALLNRHSLGASWTHTTVNRKLAAVIGMPIENAPTAYTIVGIGRRATLPADQLLLVNAAARDEIATLAIGFAEAGQGSIAASLATQTVQGYTRAVIADHALVFADPTKPIDEVDLGRPSTVDASVRVLADQLSRVASRAGALAGAGHLSLGAAVSATELGLPKRDNLDEDRRKRVEAAIESGAIVESHDTVELRATSTDRVDAFAVGVGVAVLLGRGGSGTLVNLISVTRAHIDAAKVTAGANVILFADRHADVRTVSGAGGAGVQDGLGLSLSIVVHDEQTTATIGLADDGNPATDDPRAEVQAAGQKLSAPQRADRDGIDNPQSRPIRGVAVIALSSVKISQTSIGVALAVDVALAPSVNLGAVAGVVAARIEQRASVNTAGGHPDQGVLVYADHEATVSGLALTATAAVALAVGASVDAALVTVTTEASVDGVVSASLNLEVRALAALTLASASTSDSGSLAINLVGSAGLVIIAPTTRAYLGSHADVVAQGTVAVIADHRSDIVVTSGHTDLSLLATGGVTAAAIILRKLTSAFIAGGASVTALGRRPGLAVNTAQFTAPGANSSTRVPGFVLSALLQLIGLVVDNPLRQLARSLFGFSDDLAFLNLTPIDAPPVDGDLTERRFQRPVKVAVRGLAVTATSRDNTETMASGVGLSLLTTATAPATAVAATNETLAYIAAGAQVNVQNATADPNQEVRVGAASDLHHLGVARTVGAGTQAVSLAASLVVSNIITRAFIGFDPVGDLTGNPGGNEQAGATLVNAKGDVLVTARAGQDVLLVALAFNLGVAEAEGSMPVAVIGAHTYAYIGPGVRVDAGGDVLVLARDDTDVDLFAGSGLAGGFSAGASFVMTLVHKDTRAWISFAVVNAAGLSATGIEVSDGTPTGIKLIHGVGVQARSSESVFGLAESGRVGVLSVAGAAGFAVVDSDTSAYVDDNTVINLAGLPAGATQSVSIAATNDSHIFGMTISLPVTGLLTIGVGIDIGIFDNDTSAVVKPHAQIRAAQDIEVRAATAMEGDSFIGTVPAVVPVGVGAAASLYKIRGDLKDPICLLPFEPLCRLPIDMLNSIDGTRTVPGSLDRNLAGIFAIDGPSLGRSMEGLAGVLPILEPARQALLALRPGAAAADAIDNPGDNQGALAQVDGATLIAG